MVGGVANLVELTTLFGTMVEAHCVRDKSTNANPWLIVSGWLMLRVRFSFFLRKVHSSDP